MSQKTIATAYAAIPGLQDDPGQRAVVVLLDSLQRELQQTGSTLRSWWRRLPIAGSTPPVTGLYLWGDVGRGKTFLMDLFFETLTIEDKKRIHFHRMMREVHQRLGEYSDERDPLDRVAGDIAASTRVLCFDEFFVSDIGDAMILGRLLDGLFRRGVTLVTTSNLPPQRLYANGLQRQQFLPAIALLEAFTRVVELDGGADYRLRLLQQAGTYLTPADEAATLRLRRFFDDVAESQVETNRDLDINGRPVRSIRCAKSVAWFDFHELCDGPRSQSDYIEIARWYPTVILTGVPTLGVAGDDPARRFISLVDEFYDRRVKLLVSADQKPAKLYQGERLQFEFQRTISRLSEMQSAEYLHEAHRA